VGWGVFVWEKKKKVLLPRPPPPNSLRLYCKVKGLISLSNVEAAILRSW
jgi:hypothetical protein